MSERRKTAEYPVSDFISAGTGSIFVCGSKIDSVWNYLLERKP